MRLLQAEGDITVVAQAGNATDAVAVIEWEVTAEAGVAANPCRVYAQENQAEDNAGTNACIGIVDTSSTASFAP